MKTSVRAVLALNALFCFALFVSGVFANPKQQCEEPMFWSLFWVAVIFVVNVYYILYHEHVEQWSGKIDRRVRGNPSGDRKD